MPRVHLLAPHEAPLTVRDFFAEGDPGPIAASLAQVPELLGPAMAFVGAALGPGAVDARAREMVVLRCSAVQRCRYCTQTHSAVALDAGFSLDEVRALRGEAPLEEIFSDPRDLALLAWTDAMATGPGQIADGLHAALALHFAEHEIVELALLASATVMLNRYCSALLLPVDEEHLRRLARECLGELRD